MEKAFRWLRNGFALAGVLALGFWLGSDRAVKASGQNVDVQFTSVDPSGALLVHNPGSSTVYVYQGAMTGNAELQCSFMFQMEHPGGTINRVPCAIR